MPGVKNMAPGILQIIKQQQKMKKDIKLLSMDTPLVMNGIVVKFADDIIGYFSGFAPISGEPDRGTEHDCGEEYDCFSFNRIAENPDVEWQDGYVHVKPYIGGTEWWDGIPYPYEFASLEDIDKMRSITSLTKEELVELASHISFGSIYLSDYNNRMFVDRDEVYSYSEGYLGEIGDEDPIPEGFAKYVLGE